MSRAFVCRQCPRTSPDPSLCPSSRLTCSLTVASVLLSLCSCCGAGTAADTEKTTEMVSSNLTIFSLNSGRNPRVVMAVSILQDMLYRFVFPFDTYLCLRVWEWVIQEFKEAVTFFKVQFLNICSSGITAKLVQILFWEELTARGTTCTQWGHMGV